MDEEEEVEEEEETEETEEYEEEKEEDEEEDEEEEQDSRASERGTSRKRVIQSNERRNVNVRSAKCSISFSHHIFHLYKGGQIGYKGGQICVANQATNGSRG